MLLNSGNWVIRGRSEGAYQIFQVPCAMINPRLYLIDANEITRNKVAFRSAEDFYKKKTRECSSCLTGKKADLIPLGELASKDPKPEL